VLKGFKNSETEAIWNRQPARRFQSIARIALRKLWMLAEARSLIDLTRPPANRLEKLEGDRAGQYSIRINDQYRICFTWDGADADNVEIVDYH
jgi:proteic killer suppression protein